jgi:hypothetical protein
VAMRNTVELPMATPIKPTTPNKKPTNWANCGGLTFSNSPTPLSLGLTNVLKIKP